MIQILTLHLDPASQSHFEALRQRHFPPERNQIPAHITLFHHLPDIEAVDLALHQAADRPAFPINVTGLRSLGKGVAYTLASTELLALQKQLADAFADELTPQDRQRFAPHIVVQNKATPDQARTLLTQLQRDFQPMTLKATGIDQWEYLGGPWRHLKTHTFL